MITTEDFISYPFTPDLTQAGIAFAHQSISLTNYREELCHSAMLIATI